MGHQFVFLILAKGPIKSINQTFSKICFSKKVTSVAALKTGCISSVFPEKKLL